MRDYTVHRLAWFYMTGAWPSYEIDHVNMDRTDNHWCNLREATPTQNRGNTRKRAGTTSSFKGVSWNRRLHKWESYLGGVGCKKKMHLGFFDTSWRAYSAYCIAARKHFGEFARLYDDAIMIEPGPQSLGNDWLGI